MNQGRRHKTTEVTAYSGYKANERPVQFWVDGAKLEVKEIRSRWTGQDHDYFKVVANDGCEYLLKWHRFSDEWYFEKC